MAIDTRPVAKDVKIRIPEDLHSEPVISNLISQHGVTVNIISATLGVNAGSGWFHLGLNGNQAQIQTAIAYLNDLDIEIWEDNREPNTAL
ncbi:MULTISPECIES: NIL domain-containing protein [Pseudanabaena]|uniref:NIL domain-containing protein n=1 Tax=Pseudanabaena TaxID=1152 RepID=UPI002478FEE6|nr:MULTISPECIES: NIL domain-containing protein [Pseudanabaena]MEA5487541.1 NIL domain-containing protein [Pseudanabaena sp. CCNP1317]WGS73986.1 NIL domain-containing protein [Pseudanabaena galeata CCNP1313]